MVRRVVLCSVCKSIQRMPDDDEDKRCPNCGHTLKPYKKKKKKKEEKDGSV